MDELYLIYFPAMQVNQTRISETSTQLTIAARADELKSIKDTVVRRLGKDVRVSGFRNGKAPHHLIEKALNPQLLQQEFLEEAVNELYVTAVTNENIRPVALPNITIKKFVPFTDLEFEAAVDAIGTIKLPNYKKSRKQPTPEKVTSSNVQAVLDRLASQTAEKMDVSRTVKNGDEAWIDFTGVDAKGSPIQGADGKDYPLGIGSNTFIPGFEENIVGMNIDEEKAFTLTFPKDYGAKAIAGKKVTFTVRVNKVKESIPPKLDDDFAAKIGPFKNMQELKKDISKQLEAESKNTAEKDFEAELIREIASEAVVPVPESLLEEQLERDLQEYKQNLTYRGVTFAEYLESIASTEEAFRKSLKSASEEKVKIGLVLSEIAEKEKIQVESQEIDDNLHTLMGHYKDAHMQDELKKPQARREVASRLLAEKTIQKLKEYSQSSK